MEGATRLAERSAGAQGQGTGPAFREQERRLFVGLSPALSTDDLAEGGQPSVVRVTMWAKDIP